MIVQQTRAARRRINNLSEAVGNLVVDAFHNIALFTIGAAVVWSAIVTFTEIASTGKASIDDVLLLFIYLELGAMVGIYFRTKHMPVRFLIYVSITALTRTLVSEMQHHNTPDQSIILISGAILLLSLATLIIRYGSAKFPSAQNERTDEDADTNPKHSKN
jgi:phosphate starvation-inducible membrane PsiE